MKKAITFLLAVLWMLQFSAVQAADNIVVQLNGKPLEFQVQPKIVGGRTFVPIREIAEALGGKVEFDSNYGKIRITRDKNTVTLKIGDIKATLDNDGESRNVLLDEPPFIDNGRTMVPLRSIGEAFDCKVGWDRKSKTAVIIDLNAVWNRLAVSAPHIYGLLNANILKYNFEMNQNQKFELKYSTKTSENGSNNFSIVLKDVSECNVWRGNMQSNNNIDFQLENTKKSLIDNSLDSSLKSEINYSAGVIIKDGTVYVRRGLYTLGFYDLFGLGKLGGKWIKLDDNEAALMVNVSIRDAVDNYIKTNYSLTPGVDTYSQLEAATDYIGLMEKTLLKQTNSNGKTSTSFKADINDMKRLIPADSDFCKAVGLDALFRANPSLEISINNMTDKSYKSDTEYSIKLAFILDGGKNMPFANGTFDILFKGSAHYVPLSEAVEISAPSDSQLLSPDDMYPYYDPFYDPYYDDGYYSYETVSDVGFIPQ